MLARVSNNRIEQHQVTYLTNLYELNYYSLSLRSKRGALGHSLTIQLHDHDPWLRTAKMFTKNTLRGLETFFRLHSYVKAGPFTWSSESGSVSVAKSKLHKICQAVSLIWVLVNSAWMPINFVHKLLHGAPTVTTVLNFLYTLLYLSLCLYRWNYFSCGDSIRDFVTCTLQFNRQVLGTCSCAVTTKETAQLSSSLSS